MNWPLLAGSLAGVLALAAIAWLMGLGGGAIGEGGEAMRTAEAACSGFRAERAFVSRDGRAALIEGAEGDLVLLKVHGVHVAARRLAHPAVLEASADGIVIATGERMFGQVRLVLGPEDRDKLLTLCARMNLPNPVDLYPGLSCSPAEMVVARLRVGGTTSLDTLTSLSPGSARYCRPAFRRPDFRHGYVGLPVPPVEIGWVGRDRLFRARRLAFMSSTAPRTGCAGSGPATSSTIRASIIICRRR
jgi:hypothetical protein